MKTAETTPSVSPRACRAMEQELKLISRLQKKAKYDIVIQRYDYLVKHVKAIHILPHLVSSKLVEPDFHQYLDGERTERDKMMVLLRELFSSPQSWFRSGFIGALSKYPQYQTIADVLLTGESHSYFHELATTPRTSRAETYRSLCSLRCRFHQSHGEVEGPSTL